MTAAITFIPLYGVPCAICGQPAHHVAIYNDVRLINHNHDSEFHRGPANQCVLPNPKD